MLWDFKLSQSKYIIKNMTSKKLNIKNNDFNVINNKYIIIKNFLKVKKTIHIYIYIINKIK